jgi:hypothetical protein
MRDVALASLPLADDELRELHARAAGWYAAQRRAGWRCARGGRSATTPRRRRCSPSRATLLREGAEAVVEAGGAMPAAPRRGARAAGRARPTSCAATGTRRSCVPAARRWPGPIDAGLAWRIGLIHHLRGHLDEALAAYRRGRDDAEPSGDLALLHAWHASAHWLRGDADRCRTLATQAYEVAVASGEDRALAAAHTVLAMLAALEGDRASNDAHYLRALVHERRATRCRSSASASTAARATWRRRLRGRDGSRLAIRLADLAASSLPRWR